MKIFHRITPRSILAGIIISAAVLTGANAWAGLTHDQARALTNKVRAGDKAALQTLKAQAQKGNPYAQNGLGYLYDEGYGVAQDWAQAERWSRKAAAQGNAYGQVSLGYLYENGHGVAQNYAQAAQWYRKAAEQGNAYGQTNLGNLYYYGHGVKRDYAQAAQWYRKAAEQGDAYGQSSLGSLYEHGQGVGQDIAQARQWYHKAAAQGDAHAQRALDNLNNRVRPRYVRHTGITIIFLGLYVFLGVCLGVFLLLRRWRHRRLSSRSQAKSRLGALLEHEHEQHEHESSL